MPSRWAARLGAGAAVLGVLLVGVAPAASAHPLGNFTVNHYDGLHLYVDHVDDDAVIDTAEIPTLQVKTRIDRDGNGQISDSEGSAYATQECAALAAADQITVGGQRLTLQVTSSDFTLRPGAVGLNTSRLGCRLTAKADLSSKTTVVVSDTFTSGGVGWHEITATGTGVSIQGSPVPATSVSDRLLHYPNDLLSSPLDVRQATLTVVPGGASTYAVTSKIPAVGFGLKALNAIANTFNGLVARDRLTFGIGLLAILLAMLLGAGHAFLPGHGKTVMAAYLVGRRGRLRDVIAVGATVTLTHTAGVLIVGALISVSAAFAPTAVEQDLGIVSGLIIAGVGVGLLVSAIRRRNTGARGSQSERSDAAMGTAVVDRALVEAAPVDAALVDVASVDAALVDVALLTVATGASDAGHDDVPAARHALDAHVHGTGEHGHGHAHPHEHAHAQAAPGHDHGDGAHTHIDHGHVHDPHEHEHGHVHDVHQQDPQEHGHRHGFGRRHSHGPGHSHGVVGPDGEPSLSRAGLVGLGVAGGLVPSPSALLVLLAAIGLGRTVFGITLVFAYGVGMAAALTAAGLLLVRFRARMDRLVSKSTSGRLARLLYLAPFATASLVLLVGVGLTLRGIAAV